MAFWSRKTVARNEVRVCFLMILFFLFEIILLLFRKREEENGFLPFWVQGHFSTSQFTLGLVLGLLF